MTAQPFLATQGMNRRTGELLSPKLAHIQQSLWDIFTTPIGTRIQRRAYGSHLFDLIDQPMTPPNRLRLVVALVDAAMRWEPRVVITWAKIEVNTEGKILFHFHARTKTGEEIRHRGILV
ncbi:GPW/gp25 family protein [Histophilus somni]|uniref:GPW/gp25 family protein n=1 Tax=Histophilus somni TaxID=731 RepID=UPI00201E8022|nr:GPW/gp25 family protein [Histophilus somni]